MTTVTWIKVPMLTAPMLVVVTMMTVRIPVIMTRCYGGGSDDMDCGGDDARQSRK